MIDDKVKSYNHYRFEKNIPYLWFMGSFQWCYQLFLLFHI